ncbi:MAG: hypothetical protein AAF657_24350 [Acidobacteriota bacterium]
MKTGLKSKLREKVPEMILEAVSVVLAVLLALAVDAWREDRRHAREADRARQGVLDEIASNHEELAENAEGNRAMLATVRQVVEALGTEEDQGSSAEFSVALLSSATWDTAKLTLSVDHLDFDWVARISKLYELQGLFNRRQDELVSFLSSGTLGYEEDQFVRSMHRRLETVVELQDGLLVAYAKMHPDLADDPVADEASQES